MNLNLLIDGAYISLLSTYILEAIALIIVITISKERFFRLRRKIDFIIGMVFLGFFITFTLLAILDYYNPLKSYETMVPIKGHIVEYTYRVFPGGLNYDFPHLMMAALTIGFVLLAVYFERDCQIQLERCEKGET